MKKAQPFEAYFNDNDLSEEKLARMRLTRQLVHTIYPDVQERVSYAMPGFYPKQAKKATQQLFLLMANKGFKGEVVLGDEFSPDGSRLWDKETLDKMDKDRFRQSLGGLIEAYEAVAHRLGVKLD